MQKDEEIVASRVEMWFCNGRRTGDQTVNSNYGKSSEDIDILVLGGKKVGVTSMVMDKGEKEIIGAEGWSVRKWKRQARGGEGKRDCPMLLVRNKKKWKINAEEIGKGYRQKKEEQEGGKPGG
ncbi:hypothetical protein FH972_019947 [Carpinus fangiana]|uniref:Uncharacterized protein n=1 Tax=Carpinus fangiana TaxID=176857 RepID=A0A5N6RS84_9ROSI|nr:hypothetical protein FH972_019947 [Carpinus fangiana]